MDGPLKFVGDLENGHIVPISKYGRNFSIIRVPYAFKLLMQELKTMNIQMRVITEDNVDQLMNMLGNNDISKQTELTNLTDLGTVMREKIDNELRKEDVIETQAEVTEFEQPDWSVTSISTNIKPNAYKIYTVNDFKKGQTVYFIGDNSHGREWKNCRY